MGVEDVEIDGKSICTGCCSISIYVSELFVNRISLGIENVEVNCKSICTGNDSVAVYVTEKLIACAANGASTIYINVICVFVCVPVNSFAIAVGYLIDLLAAAKA